MVKIEILLKTGKIVRLNELELNRYTDFFDKSYKDNLDHSKSVMQLFPRWSIISGYYAMHDITKLMLAKKFLIKVEYKVHSTTIQVLDELIKNKEIIEILKCGYNEFISLANDLAKGKKERVKTQYYTGTEFMKSEYQKRAQSFLRDKVEPYIEKIKIAGDLK